MSDDELVPRVEAILLASHDDAHDYATEIVRTVREVVAEEILTVSERQAPHPFTFHERNVLRIAARLVRRGEQQ